MSGALSLPEFFEHFHRRAVIHAHHQLQHAHQLRAAQRPAIAQHLVVHVLNANSGELAKDVQGVKYFLKVDERHFQRQALPLDLDLQSGGGVAMASAGVKENKMDAASSVLLRRAFRLPSIVAPSSIANLFVFNQ